MDINIHDGSRLQDTPTELPHVPPKLRLRLYSFSPSRRHFGIVVFMKALLQAGFSGQVHVPPGKRFLIRSVNLLSNT